MMQYQLVMLLLQRAAIAGVKPKLAIFCPTDPNFAACFTRAGANAASAAILALSIADVGSTPNPRIK